MAPDPAVEDAGEGDSREGLQTDRYARRVTFERISVDPGKMGGVPCIRDLRIPVATVVAMVADGMTVDEILADVPELEAEDIQAALHFAAEAVRERTLPLTPGA